MRQNKSRMSRLFWQLRQLLQVSAYPTFCSRPWENQNKKRVGRTIWIWQSSWGWVSEWITLYIRDQSTAFGEKSTLSGEVFHWQWWIAFSPQRLTDGSHQYPIHYDVSTPIKDIANALFQTFPADLNRFKKTKYPKYIQCCVCLNLSIRHASRRQWCSKTNRQMALRYHLLKSRYSERLSNVVFFSYLFSPRNTSTSYFCYFSVQKCCPFTLVIASFWTQRTLKKNVFVSCEMIRLWVLY